MITTLLWISFGLWLIILLLPWRPWSTRPSLEAGPVQSNELAEKITVLIPARNEADVLDTTLPALQSQGKHLNIILIDDRSEDSTAETALRHSDGRLTVLSGSEPPAGWSGKLWALEQGRRHIQTEYTLLLDADIELRPGILSAAYEHMENQQIPFVSLMTEPRMQGFWEQMLMPAFIYFFKLLYPFHIANSQSRLVSAAAGGFILVRTDILENIGGFASLKGALIDDCTLARNIKHAGYRIWLGLTRSAKSLRNSSKLADIWNMVARTAFTQLKYSFILLLLCTLVMFVLYAVPVISLFSSDTDHLILAVCALLLMMLSYLPILRYYGLSPLWLASFPLTGVLYFAMTWSSALRYWRGTRSVWKGRTYTVDNTDVHT